ncbi:hypothetical protein DVR12_18580 [Chitinophaga silvatica]|uniref:Uncharacterized protein n=1 Tax=Chitinophaga silvatica TaxID=2282649 RepID=A0A3E1Y6L6_9BACT|nr:hypothetical protein [Chitinophaga silvatica]RFS20569.1 hypothetical protein DVR12_18580 [Chitinophaga silvatica]
MTLIKQAELPVPFLFNPLKHHLGVLHQVLAQTPFPEVFILLKKLGASQMDMYTGLLSLPEIISEIKGFLEESGIFEHSAFHNYLIAHQEFITIKLSDSSEWILREAKGESYVHVHPGRHVPHTLRIKATALKTALAYQAAKQQGLLNGELQSDINKLRKQLELSPVRNILECQHLLELVYLLATID